MLCFYEVTQRTLRATLVSRVYFKEFHCPPLENRSALGKKQVNISSQSYLKSLFSNKRFV